MSDRVVRLSPKPSPTTIVVVGPPTHLLTSSVTLGALIHFLIYKVGVNMSGPATCLPHSLFYFYVFGGFFVLFFFPKKPSCVVRVTVIGCYNGLHSVMGSKSVPT